jgi:hypothetical protein
MDLRTRTRRGKALDFLVVTNTREVAKTHELQDNQNPTEI